MATHELAHAEWPREQIDLIRRTVCAGASDDELALYLATSRRLGLDPLTRQIHAVRRWDSRAGREVMAIQVGIDGLRLAAHRTGEMDGYDPPQWCGPDGVWQDVWLGGAPPAAARVTVYRRGHSHPYTAVATYAEYCQRGKDGRPAGLWARMPALMISKVAEALALRRAFPVELAGVYEPAELDQVEVVPPAQTSRSDLSEAVESQPQPNAQPDRMTDRQRRHLMSLCTELGLERPERLQLASAVIGRPLGSAADLTTSEAQRVIHALSMWRDYPPTADRLAQSIRSAGDDIVQICANEGAETLDDIPAVRRWELIRAYETARGVHEAIGA